MVQKSPKTIYQILWNSADILRSKMDASEYKNYMLGLIFYKYLSDNMLHHAAELLEEDVKDLDEAQAVYEKAYNDPEIKDDLIYELNFDFSYSLEPKLTFTSLMQSIYKGKFQLEDLAQGFRNIEQSSDLFENLFEDIDLYSRKLGASAQKQNQTISAVMKEMATLDMAYEGDVLGDAYEYLIGQFASDSGKKAGEFYTPQAVSKLMTQIVLQGKEDQKGFSVYDPTMGSGSLLLNVKKYSNEPGTVSYFGQELNTSTYNLARMNMFLHKVDVANQHLHNADTLDADWPTEEPTNFDAVLMNPPYSAKWSADKGFLDDPRFSMYGRLAPKSKADFAFLLHGYYHLKDSGVMAIVLPHGVLFRSGAEGKIRQSLLENGSIDTVIGLPANIFYNTSIPTTVIILKKNRDNKEVLFIDASEEYAKVKTQNILEDKHIAKILETYKKRDVVDKYSYVASYAEIVDNDYNLNIPRYVDTFEEEEPISLTDVSKEIQSTQEKIEKSELELINMLKDLKGSSESAQNELDSFYNIISKRKKAFLQKMFPKKGEKTPDLRFSGFKDDWEIRKFGEIVDIQRGLTYKPSNVSDDGIRVLRSSNVKEDTFKIFDDDIYVNEDAVNKPLVNNGDIIVTAANGSTRLVGKHAVIENLNSKAVHGGFMLLIRSKNNYFINAWMSSTAYSRILNVVQGGNGAIGNLSKSMLDNSYITLPCEEEQFLIGNFFKELDNSIALQEEKLESLKQMKKAFLQKMFV